MINFSPIGDDILEIRVSLPVSCERVYRAWTEALELVQWFRGSPDGHLEVTEFDCRDGGGYDFTMVNASGERFNLAGTYLKLVPNQQIDMTWYWKSEQGTTPPSKVAIEIEPEGAGALLVIRHEKFLSPDDRDNHGSGWEPCLDNLVEYLGSLD